MTAEIKRTVETVKASGAKIVCIGMSMNGKKLEVRKDRNMRLIVEIPNHNGAKTHLALGLRKARIQIATAR